MLDFANNELHNDPLKLLEQLTKDTVLRCDLQQIDIEFKNDLQQNFDRLVQLSAERAQTSVNEAEDLALREIRRQMRELAAEAFYTQIKTFTSDRLVIMLDTCEWLNEPEGIEVGQWVLNELIPGIRTRIRQEGRQCSIVMASRVQPRLDVIRGPDQRRLTLSMLGKAEVDQYLSHLGMHDPDLRQRVYDVTHGHALCVSIIGDFWQNRGERERPFTIEDFPQQQLQEFSEKALVSFTNERVLKHLKSPYKELTRYGVLLRSFDLPLLKNVFPELLPEPEALEYFNQLIRYPYIESRGNYRYAFHELVHEALAEETQREEPETWKSYHKRALDYFTTVSPRPPDRHYHLLAYDEEQGLLEWQQAIQEARESGKREYIGALLQAALDKALKLSPAACAEIVYEQGRFNYYGVQWEEAIKSYQEALTSFQELGDHSGQAKVLQAMGDVQRVLAKQDDALESYENALAAFRQAGDQLGEARCYQAMADVWRLRNDQDAALRSYEQALNLFRQVGNQPEEAKVLEALGDVQRLRNEQDAALRSYEQALALYQEEKDRLKRAKLLKAIGDVQRLQQDQDAALESYAQALALFGELKEPAEEANVRRAMEEVQQPQSEQVAPPEEKSVSQIEPSVPIYTQKQGDYAASIGLPRFLGVRAILLIVLALLIVAGSIGLFFNPQINSTSSAQATAFARFKATITAQTQAKANPYLPGRGTLAFSDPLSDNSKGYGWSETAPNCAFTGGTYHATAPDANYADYCLADASNLSDFVVEAQMQVVKGDGGGIVFRVTSTNPNNEYYEFVIFQDGSYDFYLVTGNSSSDSKTLTSGSNPAITQGLGQTNTIAVVAQGSIITLYVNHQPIDKVTDSTYTGGQIGVVAYPNTKPTEVAFSNLKVWTLQIPIAQAKAIATAQAKATATAIVSVVAANPNPYPPGRGILAFYDPLRDNSKGNGWSAGSNNTGGSCKFIGGAYHAGESNVNFFQPCVESNDFNNFAFEVQMTIIQGDGGGIIFRLDNTKNNYYAFFANNDGSYNLVICGGGTCQSPLRSSTSSALHQGLGQSNVIAVVAQGSTITVYANQQQITSVTDSSYGHGVIGLVASPFSNNGHPTEVVYSNARVWTF